MTDVENLVQENYDIVEKWKQIKLNFAKTVDPTRRTYKYVQGKLDQANDLRIRFEEIHRKLEVSLDHDHEYFKMADEFIPKDEEFRAELRQILETLAPKLDPELVKASRIQKKRMNNCLVAADRAEKAIADRQSATTLEVVMKTLQTSWQRVLEQDEVLDSMVTGDPPPISYFTDNVLADVEERVNYMVTRLATEIGVRKEEVLRQTKLPSMKLPVFNGDFTKWPLFEEMFARLVHDNKSINDTQKFEYLKTSVIGEPAALIQSLALEGKNYITALKILKARYDNKRKIATVHLDKMLHNMGQTSPKQILDRTRECAEALKNMKLNTMDTIMIYLMSKRMHPDTRIAFEQQLKNPSQMPTLNEFYEFLETRFQAMESIPKAINRDQKGGSSASNFRPNFKNHVVTKVNKCGYCKEDHRTVMCPAFAKLNVSARYRAVQENKLCGNCLQQGHIKVACQSKFRCKKCNKNHNTLLHEDQNHEGSSENEIKTHVVGGQKSVLLATAVVKIKGKDGEYHFLRALVDPGSQASFITEHAAQLVKLPRQKVVATISGMSQMQADQPKGTIRCEMQPRFASTFKTMVSAIIMKSLTGILPNERVKNEISDRFKDLIMADPAYNEPQAVDMMLGAEVFAQIAQNEIIHGEPAAQKTALGWIVFGKTEIEEKLKNVVSMTLKVKLDEQIQKFWEQEELNKEEGKNNYSEADQLCEKIYEKTVQRDSDGRYVVKVPFIKEKMKELGESKNIAVAMLTSMEKKFVKNPQLKEEYSKFIAEYIKMGHMSEVPRNFDIKYYIPHHAVIKPDSTTTKLRVVFNASAKTSSGVSLNDCMLIGPKIQTNIYDVLLRWRMYPIVFTADIEKMYRQISISEEDRPYHGILWRENPLIPTKQYVLNTVTYGTAAAPYLAIRTLHQLADDEQHCKVAEKLKTDFYVDDFVSGSYSIQEAKEVIKEMIALVKKGQMNLRKWTSNKNIVLNDLKPEDVEQKGIEIDSQQSIKALGLHWCPVTDAFKFKVTLDPIRKHTKRMLVSDMTKLFDPIGLIAPVLIKAKLLMQECWKIKCDWDDLLPENIVNKWTKFRMELKELEAIQVQRWMNFDKEDEVQIHGFGDSSEDAYGALVVLRIKKKTGEIICRTLTAKTKVAPMKLPVTLPKLELCAAVLTAELCQAVKTTLSLDDAVMYGWTDSEICLSWIKGEPRRWKTYVANRVSKIHQIMDKENWRHVQTTQNPADVASRGCTPQELRNHKLWWNGPEWLKNEEKLWPGQATVQTQEEVKKVFVAQEETHGIFERFSCYQKMIRTIAFMRRVLGKNKPYDSTILSGEEIANSATTVLKMAQAEMFNDEIQSLKQNGQVQKKSSLKALNPFLDEKEILRVGGRLQNSNLSYTQKHPAILRGNHVFTRMLIRHSHQKLLHGGNQLTLAYLRQKYWVTKAKQIIKGEIRKCATCVRHKAEVMQQQMGNLPKHRVQGSRPFTVTALDFCGPFDVKLSKGRGCKSYKGYVCIFICMSTKAVHLELVESYNSQDFIAALKRFIARRGLCKLIYCDNGTNFVGAKRLLDEEFQKALKQSTTEAKELLANDQINWHFNVPAAPHQNGLVERAVGSVKHHLKRVMGNTLFTYSEFSTLLTQIEAILNSRPICRITEDTGEQILTPSKLLIGEELLLIPEEPLLDEKISDTRKYQLITQKKQQLWKIWSNEYLNTLQTRNKWQSPSENIKKGQIVLIKNELTPPGKWSMGVVEELYPGKDDKVRSVMIKTSVGTYKRPITKVVLMPGEDNAEALEEEDAEKTKQETSTVIAQSTIIHRSKKKKNKKISFMAIAALMILCARVKEVVALNGATNGANIMQFKTQPGIYFEHIGEGSLITSHWRIVTYIDLSSYWDDYKIIRAHLDLAREFCTKKGQTSFLCQTSVRRMEKIVEGLKISNEVLLDSTLRRNKRQTNWSSLLSTGMNLVGAVTGVLSNKVAQNYNKEIELVQADESRINKLLSEKMSVVDATMNIVRQGLSDIKGEVQQMKSLSSRMNAERETAVQDHHIFSIMTHLTLIITEYKNVQDALLDVLISSYNGRMHILTMSIDQLRDQLIHIRGHLPKLMSLPDSLTDDGIVRYLKWIKTSARISNQRLIIEMKLPLLYSAEFQIFKLASVPTVINTREMAYIKPTSDYLLVTMERDKYYPLSQEELQACQEVQPLKFWCSSQHPIYSVSSTYKSCEIKLLQHNQQIPQTCRVTTVDADNYFTKLHMPNMWIYSVKAERSVDIICDSLTTVHLNGSGLIQLQPGCSLRDPDLTLIAKSFNNQSHSVSSVLPMLNLKEQMENFSHQPGRTPFIETRTTQRVSDQGSGPWIMVCICLLTGFTSSSCILCIFGWVKSKKHSTVESPKDLETSTA